MKKFITHGSKSMMAIEGLQAIIPTIDIYKREYFINFWYDDKNHYAWMFGSKQEMISVYRRIQLDLAKTYTDEIEDKELLQKDLTSESL